MTCRSALSASAFLHRARRSSTAFLSSSISFSLAFMPSSALASFFTALYHTRRSTMEMDRIGWDMRLTIMASSCAKKLPWFLCWEACKLLID